MESLFLTNMVQSLRDQHEIDLQIYRAAHRNAANRLLHQVMIPLETLSFCLFLACLIQILFTGTKQRRIIGGYMVEAVGWTLDILSWLVSPPWTVVGMATTTFHVLACGSLARRCVDCNGVWNSFKAALILWIIAWTVQVGIGHWILEGNQPNVAAASISDVSWLAMTLSVLIAWKS